MHHRHRHRRLLAIAAWLCSSVGGLADIPTGQAPGGLVLTGAYENWATQPPSFVNDVTGWRDFFNAGFLGASTTIGNVEGLSLIHI